MKQAEGGDTPGELRVRTSPSCTTALWIPDSNMLKILSWYKIELFICFSVKKQKQIEANAIVQFDGLGSRDWKAAHNSLRASLVYIAVDDPGLQTKTNPKSKTKQTVFPEAE